MTPSRPLTRRHFLALSAASAALGAACGRSPAPASGEASGPGTTTARPAVPQVLLVDGRGAGGFAAYLDELLAAEGVVGVRRVPAQAASGPMLDGVVAAVVDGPDISAAWVDALEQFARRGGAVSLITPGSAVLARFGVSEIEPQGAPPDGLRPADPAGAVLRVHVQTGAWQAAEDDIAAVFTSGRDTGAPAIIRRRHGAGMVFLWAFDVARNVAFIRQGSPARVNVERDGLPKVRFADLMVGWADPRRMGQADADAYVRLLVGQLASARTAAGPLVLVDHCPGEARTTLIATGDAHGVGADVLDTMLRRVEAGGGRLSVFYEPPDTPGWRRVARRARWAAGTLPVVGPLVASRRAPPSPALVAEWRRRGHEFAPHPAGEPDPDAGLARAWDDFVADGYGTDHPVIRTHEVLWRGWVDTPGAQRRRGVRMNLDTYQVGAVMRDPAGGWSHGHLNGSGLPARFVDEAGQVIDCYQQPTQVVDEQLLGVMGGGEGLSGREAAAVVAQQLERAGSDTPAALCAVFHADSFEPAVGRGAEAGAFLDGVLEACRTRRVPVITAGHWLRFLDARRATAIDARSWEAAAGRLTCVVRVGAGAAPGLGLLLPAVIDGRRLRDVRLDGGPAALVPLTRAGREWIRVVGRPGLVRVDARYDPA